MRSYILSRFAVKELRRMLEGSLLMLLDSDLLLHNIVLLHAQDQTMFDYRHLTS